MKCKVAPAGIGQRGRRSNRVLVVVTEIGGTIWRIEYKLRQEFFDISSTFGMVSPSEFFRPELAGGIDPCLELFLSHGILFRIEIFHLSLIGLAVIGAGDVDTAAGTDHFTAFTAVRLEVGIFGTATGAFEYFFIFWHNNISLN